MPMPNKVEPAPDDPGRWQQPARHKVGAQINIQDDEPAHYQEHMKDQRMKHAVSESLHSLRKNHTESLHNFKKNIPEYESLDNLKKARTVRHAEGHQVHPSPSNHHNEGEFSDFTVSTSMTSLETEMKRKYGHAIRAKQEETKPDMNERKKKVLSWLTKFWRSFSAVFFSPIFLRHRNIFFLFIEVIAPGIVTLIIFAAFTSGISWKQAQHNQRQAYGRILNYPEMSMSDTMAHFRKAQCDQRGRAFILYSPVTNITTQIMQHTLELLEISGQNRLHRSGQSSTGIVGIQSEIEMFERAMFHSPDTLSHGKPAGIFFRIDDKDVSNLTNFPYNVTFSISLFDEKIFATVDNYPFIEPADTEDWLSPYITSGFIGLQYAIEEAVIRLVLEKQREVEEKEMGEQAENFPKDSIERSGMHSGKISQEIDEDLFDFLKEETIASQDYYDSEDDEDLLAGQKSKSRTLGDEPSPPVHTTKDGRPAMHGRIIKTSRELPGRSLKMFSYNMFGSEDYRRLLTFVVAFSLVVSYSFMSFFIVKQIATENACGIKDLLQMHGLQHYIHWTMLFLHALIFRAITSGIVVIALKMNLGDGSIINDCSNDVLYMVIYIHELALTFMNFLIAIYIKNPKLAAIVAVFTGILSFYLPHTFYAMKLVPWYTDYVLAIIFPNWCIRQVIRCLIDHEIDEKGISWGNIFDVVYVKENTVTVGGGIIRLCIIGTIYFCLAAYIDMTSAAKLFPQSFKWYQFKEKSRQKQKNLALHDKLIQDIEDGTEAEFEKPPVYEEPPADKKCFVHIRNISKHYGTHKVALDSINLNIMHEEVTVILGHSGCGKSTLISILAGLVHPSDGYAIIKGFDVQYDASKAREYIGMCPQKLVAFNLLTVREHVRLCYMLKGYTSSECDQQVATLLTKLRLWNVRSFLPSNLTNDELRRLGMAMALADTPKVLLLDEPTYGMDSMGRKEIWDIINTLRKHHTIVLTTNYMDEAEHLADRLAFLSHGRLVCFGTPDFLKEQYETGYFLKIRPYFQSPLRLDSHGIIHLVKARLGNDNVRVQPQTRLAEIDNLVLCLSREDKDKFPDLCDELEKNMSNFNISHYSIRQVSLNDVFIKICSSVAAEPQTVELYVRRDSAGDVKSVLYSQIPRLQDEQLMADEASEKRSKGSGVSHMIDEEAAEDDKKVHTRDMTTKEYFVALLKKRSTVIKSGGYAMAFHFIIPLIFMWMVVFQAKLFVETTSENPGREMSTAPYQDRDLQLFYRMGQDDMAINYSSHVARILGPMGKELDKTDRIITKVYEVLQTDRREIGYVKDDHMAAFEFRKLGPKSFDVYDFIGYYASGALHSPSITVNVMSNVYLDVISAAEWRKGEVGRSYKVTTINDPMPLVQKGKFEDGCGVTCILLAVLMSFSIALISHYCILLPLMERETGMKHLQLMCGVPSTIYWVADYAVDVVIMFIMSCVIIIIFVADLSTTFHSVEVLSSLWLFCVLYLMWAGLMYAYFMSTIISTSMNGYNVLCFIHLFLGIIPMLWLTNSRPTDDAGIFWRNFLEVLFPPYTITAIFYNFFNIAGQRNICRGTNPYLIEICDVRYNPHHHTAYSGHYVSEKELYEAISKQDPKLTKCCDRICLPIDACFRPPSMFNTSNESWEQPGIITDTIALVLQGFIYCGLLIISDKQIFPRMIQRFVLKYLKAKEKQESTVPKRFRDVRHESLQVRSVLEESPMPEDVAMICVDLTKSTTSKMIIKDFCLEVKKGQCIAIIGRGNSGKSVIAKMIAGELIPTQGNCYIHGNSLIHHRKDYLSCIGYCPQRNCLYPELTGAQMVELMGRLRGIPQNLLNIHVSKWLKVMGLSDVAQDKCKEYGDGMKQRLRACMAFIGEPEIILLDEPTSVVDPLSRERLWAIVEHLHNLGHTVIFTSFNSQEAFSLAQKVIVIAEGSVQCIGDPEKLQRAYGRGHTIIFKVRHDVLSTVEIMSVTEGRVNAFKANVEETFKHIDLLDEQDEMLMYFLRDARLSWAEVFRRAFYLATIHGDIIENYEVSEGEIDDIFIYLTNKFHELGTPRKSDPPEFNHIDKKDQEMRDLKAAEQNLKHSGF